MSWNWKMVFSRLSRSFSVISESVQLNIARNLFRDSSFSVGSSFSSSASSRSSFKIRFCIDECSCSLPGFSGVGNKIFSSLSSGRFTCISALMYVTTSSCSVRRLRAAMSTGRIIFVSSCSRICDSDIVVSVAIVYGKSIVLAIFIATFFSLAGAVIAGATINFEHSSNRGRGWIVPVIGCSVLTGIVAQMVRVACAGIVCFDSVLIMLGLGLHFCLSSVSAIAIWIFGKSIVPCAVSRIAASFRTNASPIMGNDVWFMTMNVSSKV